MGQVQLPHQIADSAALTTEMQPPPTPVLEAGGQRRGLAGLSPPGPLPRHVAGRLLPGPHAAIPPRASLP